MRKLYLLFTVVIVGLLLFSCGIKLPQKAPEKVKVQYTKYLEFPITTMDINMRDLVGSFEQNLGNGLVVDTSSSPLTISYATEIKYTPGTFLKDVEDKIKAALSELGSRFDYKIDTAYFINTVSGTMNLPSVNPVTQEINQSEVSIGDLTLLNNVSVPVITGQNTFDIPPDVLYNLAFSEANLKSVDVEFNISGVNVTNAYLIVDSTNYPLTVNGTRNHSNILLKKSSSVKIRFNSDDSGVANITLALKNQKVDYFKELDTSKIPDGKISISVSQPIALTSGNWELSLDGNVDISLTISGFSGNVSQAYEIKSGSTKIGSGTSNSLTTTIWLDKSKLFKVGDGLTVEGTIELSGLVSADLRVKPKVNINPNVSVYEIKDYPLNVNVPLPANVTELKFSSASGSMLLTFESLNLSSVSGTFGSNNLELTSSGILIPFSNVSLPANINATISGVVTGSTLEYNLSLPDDQNIIIESAKISGISTDPISFTQNVPQELKDFANSITASVKVKINYDVTGISGIKLNITSNIFDTGTGEQPLQNEGSITLEANNKTFDFSNTSSFDLTITPTIPDPVTVSNVNLRDGVKLWIEPKLEKFEVSKVNLKGQTYTQDLGTLINFGDVFKDDLAFIKDLDLNIEAPISFNITNSTITAKLTLNLSGKEIPLENGQNVDIGNDIKELIKNGSPLSLKVKIETSSGELQSNSEIKALFNFRLPLRATPTKDIVLKQDKMDLSALSGLKDIINKGEIKFATFSNTTGLKAKLSIGNSEEVTLELKDSAVVTSVDASKLSAIATKDVPYKIVLPKDQEISFNYNGEISIAPYIAVDLKVATEVKLGN